MVTAREGEREREREEKREREGERGGTNAQYRFSRAVSLYGVQSR